MGTTWQNPIIEYLLAKRPKFLRKKSSPIPKRVRLERQIMAMLACFSVSIGLWENFRPLWLQNNGFSETQISTFLSVGMIVGVVGIILVGKFVKMTQIKRLILTSLVVRSVFQVLLWLLDGTGLKFLIVACAMIDVLTGALVITSVYPLLTTVLKSNRAYSRRKLVEYLFRDIGVLLGAMLIGQAIGHIVIDYNACLMVAVGFTIAASIVMANFRLEITEQNAKNDKFSAVKFVLKSKIHRLYMMCAFLSHVAYNTAVWLRILMLTDNFNLSAGMATTYLLVVGLASDLIGILALKYFTPKSDYLSIFIKVGTRVLIFVPALITGNLFICFVALTWTMLSSTVYENITDGYYINSVDNSHQLKYNTLRYVVAYAGEAVGLFLCGLMMPLGPGYAFGLSALIATVYIILFCRLAYCRQKYGIK